MKYVLQDKVRTKNIKGRYSDISGIIIENLPNIDLEPMYMIKYDVLYLMEEYKINE